MSLEQLRERMPALRQREQTLRAELQAIADHVNDRAMFLHLAQILTTFLARLRNAADTLDVIERQRIVRLVVKDVLVGDDTIVIRHCIPVASTLPPNSGPPAPSHPKSTPEAQSYLLRKGSDAPALNRPYFTLSSLALLQHSGGKPFLDQPHDAPVRYTVLDELHQPSLLEGIEGPLDRLPTTSTTIPIK